jgi:hypothetical protein
MTGTPYAQRKAWHEFFRDHPTHQQFGTADDESTFNGSTGCTHCLLRALIHAKTGRLYSHDEISKIAGYPWPSMNPGRRGLRWNDDELMTVVRHFGLPYELWVHDGPLSADVWDRIKANVRQAPVLIAMKYSHYPEDRGYVYNGQKADGWPNGFAIAHGKTQLTGAEGIAHAVGLISYWYSRQRGRYLFATKDPNHGSPARRERPPFDIVTPLQVRVMVASIRQLSLGGEPRPMTFLLPTRVFTPKGY